MKQPDLAELEFAVLLFVVGGGTTYSSRHFCPSLLREGAYLDFPSPIPGTQRRNGKPSFMSSYKEPSFQDRSALAKKAKQAALDQLRAKQPLDASILTERLEAARDREAAKSKARDEKNTARDLAKAEKRQRAEQKVMAGASNPTATDEERKSARDDKYAARKRRMGKK